MNIHELVAIFSGLKATPDQGRYRDWLRLARATLDPTTLKTLETRIGLENS